MEVEGGEIKLSFQTGKRLNKSRKKMKVRNEDKGIMFFLSFFALLTSFPYRVTALMNEVDCTPRSAAVYIRCVCGCVENDLGLESYNWYPQ